MTTEFKYDDKSVRNIIRKMIERVQPLTKNLQLSKQLFELSEQQGLAKELSSILIDLSAYAAGMFDENVYYRALDLDATRQDVEHFINNDID